MGRVKSQISFYQETNTFQMYNKTKINNHVHIHIKRRHLGRDIPFVITILKQQPTVSAKEYKALFV